MRQFRLERQFPLGTLQRDAGHRKRSNETPIEPHFRTLVEQLLGHANFRLLTA